MKTSLTLYIEGDEVEEMHKRYLNLSKTTETELRRELFRTGDGTQCQPQNKKSLPDGLKATV